MRMDHQEAIFRSKKMNICDVRDFWKDRNGGMVDFCFKHETGDFGETMKRRGGRR